MRDGLCSSPVSIHPSGNSDGGDMRKTGGLIVAMALAGCTSVTNAPEQPDRLVVACATPNNPHAIEACTAVINAKPPIAGINLADIYYVRGTIELEELKLPAALTDLNEAIAKKAHFDFAYHNRAFIYDLQGHYHKAIADYSRAIAIAPNIGGHYYNRARAYLHDEDYAEAARDYTITMASWPGRAGPFAGRCRARAEEGVELTFALSDCNHALSIAPGNSMFLTLRALVELKQGNPKNTIEDCKAALDAPAQRWTEWEKTRRPNIREFRPADALYLKGIAELRLGMPQKGRKDLTLAVHDAPDIAKRYARIDVTPSSS